MQKNTYQVRTETSTPDITYRLLRRLALLLPGNDRDQANVNLQEIVLASLAAQGPHGLDERTTLDVANGAAEFNDANIRLFVGVVDGYARYSLDPFADGIGDVGHDLGGLAEISTFSFFLDDVHVDFAGGDVVLPSQRDVQIAFVVAEVEIDFPTVVEDEDFAVPSTNSAKSCTVSLSVHDTYS